MENITLTQEELDKKLQSEADKRVQQALKTAKETWEKETIEKLEAEKAEAERAAKMTADEKLQEQMKQFEEERQKFQKQQLEHEATKQLADLGISTEFASFFVGENSESTKQNIEAFNVTFTSAVQAEVDKRLKGVNNAPQNPTTGSENVKLKKPWEYNTLELGDFKNNKPELYKKIMNQ